MVVVASTCIVLRVHGKRKLKFNQYSGKWEAVFGMKSKVIQCDTDQSGKSNVGIKLFTSHEIYDIMSNIKNISG